jgi:hypothetical protein
LQHGVPDWGIAWGTGGDNRYFRKYHTAGDIFQIVAGDAAFSLLGPVGPIGGLTAANDGPTLLGQLTTFTATLSSGSGVSYTWNFGDQTTGSGRIVTHRYAHPGKFTATVTAANSLGQASAATVVTITGLYHTYLPVTGK